MKPKYFITGLLLTTVVSLLVWLGIRKCHCPQNHIEALGESEEGDDRLEVRVVLE